MTALEAHWLLLSTSLVLGLFGPFVAGEELLSAFRDDLCLGEVAG